MRTTRLLGGIAALSGLMAAAPAVGADRDSIALSASSPDRHPETVSVGVGYGDLDLTSTDGRRVLDRRIWDAADRLCWRIVDPHPLANLTACRGQAVDGAREQVRQAELGASR